jgi:dihydroorotate dehydrogenase
MSSLYRAVSPLIYLLTPEQAHHSTIAMLQLGGSVGLGRMVLNTWFRARCEGPAVEAFGLKFKNPLGMAAGYDKDGLGYRGLACLGFSHIELGTVTPRPQPGNPQPRVFRLVKDHAVINRMGFPSQGAEYLARRLKGGNRPKDTLLGVNIGKNKLTPNEEAAGDYLSLFNTFAPLSDYLAVNVSSPNTPGLRVLQGRAALEGLLAPLAQARDALAAQSGRRVPLLVKLAPDLSDEELDGALEAVTGCRMDGLIISNTTIRRDGIHSPMASEVGGLSGLPLQQSNVEWVRKVVARLNGSLPVVASGGVMTPADAQARLDAGAVLVQLYTGLIYEGPGLVRDVLNAKLRLH